MGSVAITAFYAGILAIILIALSLRIVIVARAKAKVAFGDGGKDELTPVIRGQGNFIEYVPLALILIGYNEFNGASANLTHGLGIALVLARLAHPFGLQTGRGPTVPRVAGTVVTWLVLLVAAVVAIVDFLSKGAPGA